MREQETTIGGYGGNGSLKSFGPFGLSLNRDTRDREGPSSESHLMMARGGGM